MGYLPQEPELDPALSVRENVMLGVKEKKDILDRYNDLAMNYSDETAEEMAQLQDTIDAQNASWLRIDRQARVTWPSNAWAKRASRWPISG